MFTWLNKQGVKSSEGFEVQFTGRYSAEYRAGGRVVTLEVEDGISGGRPSVLVDPSAFRRWDDGELIPEDEQQRMFDNLRRAIEFQDLVLTVQAPEA